MIREKGWGAGKVVLLSSAHVRKIRAVKGLVVLSGS
jgi:hypothetical protein